MARFASFEADVRNMKSGQDLIILMELRESKIMEVRILSLPSRRDNLPLQRQCRTRTSRETGEALASRNRQSLATVFLTDDCRKLTHWRGVKAGLVLSVVERISPILPSLFSHFPPLLCFLIPHSSFLRRLQRFRRPARPALDGLRQVPTLPAFARA